MDDLCNKLILDCISRHAVLDKKKDMLTVKHNLISQLQEYNDKILKTIEKCKEEVAKLIEEEKKTEAELAVYDNDVLEQIIENKKQCPICLDEYKVLQFYFYNDCTHYLCKNCFNQMTFKVCGVCRTNVREIFYFEKIGCRIKIQTQSI